MTSLITDVISTGSTIRKQHTLYYNIILFRQKLPDEKCFEKNCEQTKPQTDTMTDNKGRCKARKPTINKSIINTYLTLVSEHMT